MNRGDRRIGERHVPVFPRLRVFGEYDEPGWFLHLSPLERESFLPPAPRGIASKLP